MQLPAEMRHFPNTFNDFFPEMLEIEVWTGAGIQDYQPGSMVVDHVRFTSHEKHVLLIQLSHRSHNRILSLSIGGPPRNSEDRARGTCSCSSVYQALIAR